MAFIIAMDYDETLFTKSVPEKGDPIMPVVNKLKEFQKHGKSVEVALWTCREGRWLKEAVDRCSELGIKFDSINENVPSQLEYMKKAKEGDSIAKRKIFAHIYVDDRAPGSIDFFLKIDVEATCKNFTDEG